jgi:Fic family protein
MAKFVWESVEWPASLRWDSAALLEPLAEVSRLQGMVLGAFQAIGLDLEEDALVDEAVTTSAIEGETLNRDSVRSSVANRLGVPTAGLPSERDRAIDGLVDILTDATRNHRAALTQERLWGWHAALFPTGYSKIRRIKVGGWREGPQAMQVVSGIRGDVVHFEAPPSAQVDREMEAFLTWWSGESSSLNGIVRAAVAHFWFVTIHPFDDGNGRIARALTDLALAQHDGREKRYFSMSQEIALHRSAYYEVLERSQRGTGDITDWIVWFLGALANALQVALDVVAQVGARARFWDAFKNVDLNARQRKSIGKMLEAGPSGYQGGMTNKKYVAITKSSKATATRDLADLEAKGVFRAGNDGGRSTYYELVWPEALRNIQPMSRADESSETAAKLKATPSNKRST